MTFYFDNAATTKIKPEVIKTMMPYLTDEYGNPSSLYTLGRRAKRAVEDAREKIAREINCQRKEIYFTSCGSESDNLAIKGVANANKSKGNHIITSNISNNEQASVIKIEWQVSGVYRSMEEGELAQTSRHRTGWFY